MATTEGRYGHGWVNVFFFSKNKKKSTAGVGLWQPWQATRVSGRGQRREAGGVPTLAPVRSQRRPQKTPNKEFWRRSADPCKREHLQAEKIKEKSNESMDKKKKSMLVFGVLAQLSRPLDPCAKWQNLLRGSLELPSHLEM